MYEMRSFREEMQRVENKLSSMADAVGVQMGHVETVLFKKDTAGTISQMIQNDKDIDAYDHEIHTSVLHLIVLQPPLPEELEKLAMMMRIAREFERIGDQIVNVAEVVQDIHGDVNQLYSGEMKSGLHDMTRVSVNMMKEAIEALQTKNDEQITKIEEKDEEVDALFLHLQRVIIDEMKKDTEKIDHLTLLILVIRYLERMADHIVNIARKLRENGEVGAAYELDNY